MASSAGHRLRKLLQHQPTLVRAAVTCCRHIEPACSAASCYGFRFPPSTFAEQSSEPAAAAAVGAAVAAAAKLATGFSASGLPGGLRLLVPASALGTPAASAAGAATAFSSGAQRCADVSAFSLLLQLKTSPANFTLGTSRESMPLLGIATAASQPCVNSVARLHHIARQEQGRCTSMTATTSVAASIPASATTAPVAQVQRASSMATKSRPEVIRTARGGTMRVEAVAARQELAGLSAVPLVPLTLGLAGAIPFVALAHPLSAVLPLPALLAGEAASAAQAAYAACILSFLGAPHWGLAMAAAGKGAAERSISVAASSTSFRFLWSVTPSLLAWLALVGPADQRFAVLIPSFLLALGVDAVYVRSGQFPSWYLPLRLTLTAVAVLSMGASAIGASVQAATSPAVPSGSESTG